MLKFLKKLAYFLLEIKNLTKILMVKKLDIHTPINVVLPSLNIVEIKIPIPNPTNKKKKEQK